MRYLLEVNLWLMAALREQVLPAGVQKIFSDAEKPLGLKLLRLWGAAKKHQPGKLPLPRNVGLSLTAAVPQHVQQRRPARPDHAGWLAQTVY